MKTLFIDCSMGAAGDMLCAALLELTDNRQSALEALNRLAIPHVTFAMKTLKKCGIAGTKLQVLIDGKEEGETDHTLSHDHRTLGNIESIIDGTNAAVTVKERAKEVFRLLADAESTVHQSKAEDIHFHEVGTLDAIADILGFCHLMHTLEIRHVTASAVNVGKGNVKCAHGILPVPAPATALLLKNVPIYSANNICGELCTPTGAALLKSFVHSFADMPVMQVEKIGYGMGTKDFECANCVRMFLATAQEAQEEIAQLSFHVDDMTAEEIAFGTEELLRAGAKDVYRTAVAMKKNRLGTLVDVLCTPAQKEQMLALIFEHSSTLGVRETSAKRHVLAREIHTLQTPLGTISRKDSEGYGVKKSKYEYDDLARLARDNNCSLQEIKRRLENEELS